MDASKRQRELLKRSETSPLPKTSRSGGLKPRGSIVDIEFPPLDKLTNNYPPARRKRGPIEHLGFRLPRAPDNNFLNRYFTKKESVPADMYSKAKNVYGTAKRYSITRTSLQQQGTNGLQSTDQRLLSSTYAARKLDSRQQRSQSTALRQADKLAVNLTLLDITKLSPNMSTKSKLKQDSPANNHADILRFRNLFNLSKALKGPPPPKRTNYCDIPTTVRIERWLMEVDQALQDQEYDDQQEAEEEEEEEAAESPINTQPEETNS